MALESPVKWDAHGQTQSNRLGAHRRVGRVAIHHAAVLLASIPAAATHRASGAGIGTCRVFTRAPSVVGIPVPCPFQHIAAHVIQAQLVGRLGSHGLRAIALSARHLRRDVVPIPCHRVDAAATGIGVVMTAVAATRGKFPLCLGGQAEVSARHLIQSVDEFLAILP